MGYTLITGASSGIGYELATLFAKNGHDLILVARQADKLKNIASHIQKQYGITPYTIPTDLSNTSNIDRLYQKLRQQNMQVDYLINNAGFYVKGAFIQNSWKKEKDLILLQCLNHTYLTKLLLPQIIASKKGGILNIASTGSFVPGPYNAIYCASKSFVLRYSEALAEELKSYGIKVTVLCPGGTATSFQDFSQRKASVLFPLMKASNVALAGYQGLMKGKRIVIPGWQNKIQVFISRFIPSAFLTKITTHLA